MSRSLAGAECFSAHSDAALLRWLMLPAVVLEVRRPFQSPGRPRRARHSRSVPGCRSRVGAVVTIVLIRKRFLVVRSQELHTSVVALRLNVGEVCACTGIADRALAARININCAIRSARNFMIRSSGFEKNGRLARVMGLFTGLRPSHGILGCASNQSVRKNPLTVNRSSRPWMAVQNGPKIFLSRAVLLSGGAGQDRRSTAIAELGEFQI